MFMSASVAVFTIHVVGWSRIRAPDLVGVHCVVGGAGKWAENGPSSPRLSASSRNELVCFFADKNTVLFQVKSQISLS